MPGLCRCWTERTPSVRCVPRKPYRSPRDWLPADQRRSFGHSFADGLDWHTPTTDLETALLNAAKQQCNLSFRIRVNSGWRKPTPALAAAVDLHVDTVRDILKGNTHATLATLHALTAELGLDLTVTSAPTARPTVEQAHE